MTFPWLRERRVFRRRVYLCCPVLCVRWMLEMNNRIHSLLLSSSLLHFVLPGGNTQDTTFIKVRYLKITCLSIGVPFSQQRRPSLPSDRPEKWSKYGQIYQGVFHTVAKVEWKTRRSKSTPLSSEDSKALLTHSLAKMTDG